MLLGADQAATGLGNAVLHCFWCNLQAAEDERLMAMKQQIHRSFDKNTVYFSPIAGQRGIDLVKWGDGYSKEITQHELEDSARDLSPGWSFIGCTGRCGVTLSTPAVHADARLPRPASTAPPSAPILSATPVLQTPAKAAVQSRTDMLHGIASWYGSVLNGHRTASGERFDMFAMTACHPTLPLAPWCAWLIKTPRNRSWCASTIGHTLRGAHY